MEYSCKVALDLGEESFDMETRGIVKKLNFGGEFKVTNHLDVVWDLLEFQKWEHVFVDDVVDEKLIREFYSTFMVEHRRNELVGTYLHGGVP